MKSASPRLVIRRAAPALGAAALLGLGGLLTGCNGKLHPWHSADVPPADGSTTPIPCPDQMVGYATLLAPSGDAGATDGGTTGGAGQGATVKIVNAGDPGALAALTDLAGAKTPGPLTIQIDGTISFAGMDGGAGGLQVRVSSNKTIVGGSGKSGLLGGGLNLTDVRNVIVRNLTIAKAANTDAITLRGATGVWIDHCDLSSSLEAEAGTFDGLVDITNQSDYVTVSWTHFHDHDDTGIVGRSDDDTADTGFLHVTYDHDLFTHVTAGPRVRFGAVHVFNVYFEDVSYYAIASTMGAHTLIENDAFRMVAPPTGQAMGQATAVGWPVTTLLKDSAAPGYVWVQNNLTDATDGPNNYTTPMTQLPVPYPYSPDLPASVPAFVAACAGPGHVTPPAP